LKVRLGRFVVLGGLMLSSRCALFAQQSYVGRYDIFSGFTYFESPHLNLAERGYHLQAGINPRTWYSLGFDYSIVTGNTSLTQNLLTTNLQRQLSAEFAQLEAAGLLPPGYQLSVPISSTTQTFAAGPQLEWRHFSKVTLFFRPSIGAVHEVVTPHPMDAVSTALIQQLAPSGKKTDWTGFYGAGGGIELLLSRHWRIRMQVDVVHDHLFDDVLKDGRNTVRASIGPAFQFGKNIVR
jgi:hypothetical protein